MSAVDFNKDLEQVFDADEISVDIDEAFSSPYHLSHTVKSGIDYLISVDSNCDATKFMSIGSQGEAILYAPDLKKLDVINSHDKTVSQAAFAKCDANLLFTSSHDGTVKLWDIRSPATSKIEFKDESKQEGPPSSSLKPILCFDTNSTNSLVCAGTEQVGSSSYLLFWDIRAGSMMGGYWESHSDDITCVKFNPDKGNMIASGDVEGTLNVFDLNEQEEDEALLCSHNAEDSVAKMTWFQKKDKMDFVAVTTHTESLQVFDAEESQLLQKFCRSDIAHSIRRVGAEHIYIVDLVPQKDQGFMTLAASRYAGNMCLRFASFTYKKLKPCINLPLDGANREVIRGCVQIPGGSGFITGSEGGIIDVWQPGSSTKSEALKMVKKSVKRSKPY